MSRQGVRATGRMEWIDITRGIAILLVILTHSIDMLGNSAGGGSPLLSVVKAAADPFRMATLMFLSGLLLSASLRKSRGRYVRGKLSRIGWPYLVWSLIYLLLLAVTTPWRGAEPVSLHDVALVFYAPPSFLWYLAYLLIYYMAALFIPARVRSWLVPVSMAASVVLGGDGNWQIMLYLFAFFLAGDFVGRNPKLWERLTSHPATVGVSAALFAGTAVASVLGIAVRYEAAWALGVAGGIVAACPLATAAARWRIARPIRSAGEQSIVFYVTHWPVLMLVFYTATHAGITEPHVITALLIAASVAAGQGFVWLRNNLPAARWLFQLPPLETTKSPQPVRAEGFSR